MAETSYPFDSAPTYEDQWRTMAKMWSWSGVVGTTRTASEPSLKTVLGSGRSFVTDAGSAWVNGHMYESTSQVTTTATNANPSSSYSRIDVLVLRLNTTSNTITRVILEGTPAASPTAPGLTRNSTTWDLPLYAATLPKSTDPQNYSNLVDYRTYAGANFAISYDTGGYIDQGLAPGDLWHTVGNGRIVYKDTTGTLRGTTNDRLVSADATAQGASDGNPVSICSVAVDAPFPYRLECHGQADIGTSSGTRADLSCRLDSASGAVVSGFGKGPMGEGAQVTVIPRSNGPYTGAHTVHLVVQRVIGTGSWSNDSLNGYLTVRVVPYIP